MNTFAKYQDTILADWNNSPEPMYTIFNLSKSSATQLEFYFIAGPPFPTGKPHLGHVAVETIKSAVLNYKAMTGFTCENRIGYDCHGLPMMATDGHSWPLIATDDLPICGSTSVLIQDAVGARVRTHVCQHGRPPAADARA